VTAPPPTLLSLHYSPWSERARWALDYQGVEYRLVQHAPFLGERRLRKVVGKRVERATVPVLVTEDSVLRDSWDIALHADARGSREKLVPSELEASIRELNDLAESTMVRSRGLVTAALLENDAALDQGLPRYVPPVLRPLLRPLSRYGTRWFARKYGLDLADLETPRRILAQTLALFRERYGTRPYLFDRFTYADIVFCSLLQGVRPVDDRYLRLWPAWRTVWTQPALAAEFSDLLERRDRLYAAHRGERAARRTSSEVAVSVAS
jgi:glutathione S-transferase